MRFNRLVAALALLGWLSASCAKISPAVLNSQGPAGATNVSPEHAKENTNESPEASLPDQMDASPSSRDSNKLPGSSPMADARRGGDTNAPKGDNEGITCPKPEPMRVRYRYDDPSLTADKKPVVDKTTDPFPTLDLDENNKWNLSFSVEAQAVECGVGSYWVAHHPGMKVRFIQDPDNAQGMRSECDVPLDPPGIDAINSRGRTRSVVGSEVHQLSVKAAAGKVSLFYDFDDDWKQVNGAWIHQGGMDCKDKEAFVPLNLTDDEYKAWITFATPLGSFNLQKPPSNTEIYNPTNNRTRTYLP